jgi:hypothetical protein
MDHMNQAGPGQTPSDQLVKNLSETASGSSTCMKFPGVMMIIDGVMLALTGIGLLICWLPIWLGVILFQAAGNAEMASKGAAVRLREHGDRHIICKKQQNIHNARTTVGSSRPVWSIR